MEKLKITLRVVWVALFFLASATFGFNGDGSARRKLCTTTPFTNNNDTSKIKSPNKAANRNLLSNSSGNCVFTISGGQCIGSVLTVAGNQQPEKIEWKKDGITVETQTAGKFSNPVVVAGGHGAGSNANQLNGPDRLWIDAADNIYIPDYYNARVQKWAPGATAGVTVAGGNGAGNAANQLDHPSAVFTDAAGNVYIADQHNYRVQKWAPGAVTGETLIANLSAPTGIFVDNNGYIYVAEELGYVVKKYAPGSTNGIVVAGGNGQGPSAKQLDIPTGLFVDNAGNVFVSDENNNRIQKWSPGATTGVTAAGGHGAGNAANQLNYPVDVCVDAFGNKYISDFRNNRVMEWEAGATSGTVIANNINASGITIAVNNSLYVADFAGHKVLKFTNPLNGTYTAMSPGTYSAVVTSKTGCVVTTNTIEVIATETPQVTISSNTTIVCPQFAPVFKAVPVSGGTAPLYQWQVNGVNSGSNNSSATFSGVNLNPGDVVSCVLTSNYPCVTGLTATSNNITLTAPTEVCSVKIAADNTEICYGTDVTFTAVPTNGGILPTYQWMINDQASGSGSTFITNALNDGDKVSCIMTSNAAICQVSTTANSNIIPIIVHAVLSPAITISSASLVYLANSTITFTELATDGGTVPAYQWQVNGVNAGTNSPTYVTDNLVNGDEISCTLTSSATCVINASAASNKLVIKIITKVIAPNTFTPNGDGINDNWDLQGIAAFPQCIVSIFTRYGQPVFHSVGYGQAWDGTFKGRRLSPGTYYYAIKLDDSQTISGSVTILR